MVVVVNLIICHQCNKKIENDDAYTIWADSIYCDNCFEVYLESIKPDNWDERD